MYSLLLKKILFLKNKQALYTLRWRDKVYLDKGSERGSCMVLTKRQSYFRNATIRQT